MRSVTTRYTPVCIALCGSAGTTQRTPVSIALCGSAGTTQCTSDITTLRGFAAGMVLTAPAARRISPRCSSCHHGLPPSTPSLGEAERTQCN